MAVVTVTPANVRPLTGAVIMRGEAGGTITLGSPVYLSSGASWIAADASGTVIADAKGMLVGVPGTGTTCSSGDTVDVCLWGPVTGFSSLTPGALYYVSDTAGSVDSAAGTKTRVIGYALSPSILMIDIGHVANTT